MTEKETSITSEIEALQERIAALEKLVAQLSLDKLMLESTIMVLEQRGEPVKKEQLEIISQAVARRDTHPQQVIIEAICGWLGLSRQAWYQHSRFRDLAQARRAVRKSIWLYNHERPHLALAYRTPAQVHVAG